MRVTLWLAVVSLGLWGCGNRGEYRTFNEKDNVTTPPPDAHGHDEHGPNGGHIVILGDHAYHTEVVFDPTTRDVTVYLLDHDMHATPLADAAVSLKLEGAEPIALAATPLDGEPAGQSSRFKATGDKLPESVKTEEDLHGSVELTAAGQTQSGEISHDHGHDDHDHAHEDHAHDEHK
ncbi:MAG: hypothetical protein U0992_03445 [Planctomycetaceae bacterium]